MPRPITDPVDRVLPHVTIVRDGCWEPRQKPKSDGYVHTKDQRTGKNVYVHRVVYEHFKGPIPAGLKLDHLCHNTDPDCPGGWACKHRACCNPDHLEPATTQENLVRGNTLNARNAAKTHCPQGHEFTPENTRLYGPARKWRACRTCDRANWTRGNARRRVA